MAALSSDEQSSMISTRTSTPSWASALPAQSRRNLP